MLHEILIPHRLLIQAHPVANKDVLQRKEEDKEEQQQEKEEEEQYSRMRCKWALLFLNKSIPPSSSNQLITKGLRDSVIFHQDQCSPNHNVILIRL